MRRFFAYGLTIALLVACSTQEKDFQTPVQEDVIYYATFEQPAEEGTRVYANEDLLLRWTADDRVSIFGKNTYNQQYKFLGETGDNSGGFNKVDGAEYVTGNPISHTVSVYPYQASTKITEDEVLAVTLPAEQHYAENTFGLGDNTMVSVSEDNFLQYKNVGGYLMLKLYGNGVSVSSITLRGNNGEKLAGKATVTMPLDGVPTAVMADDATTEITLTCATPVQLGATEEESTQFWFVVPPVTFSKGFTISVNDSSGGTFEKSTDKTVIVERNNLSKMSPIEVEIINNIVFADENLKAKLVAAFDTNGDGELSFEEAAEVTSIQGVFGETKGYMSFDEFQYFTSVSSIPAQMFQDWALLESIVLPESISNVGWYAFQSCTKLKQIVIPDGVKVISDYAFEYCRDLTTVKLPKSLESLGVCAFSRCTSLSSIELPSTLKEIGAAAFSHCEELCLSSEMLPDGLVKIGYSAFSGCSKITSVVIPNTVTTIEYSAFKESGLRSVQLPSGLEIITLSLFQGCVDLASITIPDTVFKIENSAFKSSGLEEIILPQSLSEIGYDAFNGCKNLVSISFSNRISRIGARAFGYCEKITTLSIPESVTSIGAGAFQSCTGLQTIYLKPTTPPSIFTQQYISSSPILSGASNCPIYVPAGSVEAYKEAEGWSDYADRIQAIPSSAPIPEAVDLGLPSGLKWASFNLGATKPEEYGDYYAWGETEPYYNSQDPLTWKEGKEAGYDWASYRWCMGSYTTMTKYCQNPNYGYNGFTDDKTVLDLEDDAAHVNLGGSWRMPTDAELTELIQNCTWTWTTQNGVDGRLVTGPNGNSIFLPAAGLRGGTSLGDVGSIGYYWVSSLGMDGPRSAWYVNFYSGGVYRGSINRFYGFSVRPVTE